MSVWQYMAAVDGYLDAHCPEDERGLSSKEQDELAEWMGI